MPYTVNICQLVQIVDGDRAQNRSEPRRSVTQASQSRPQLDLHSKDNYDDDNDVATLWLVSLAGNGWKSKKAETATNQNIRLVGRGKRWWRLLSVNKLSYNGSMGQAVAAPVPQLPVRKGSKHGLVEHFTHTHTHSHIHTVIQRLRNEQVQRECGHWKMLPQLLIQLLTCHSVAASPSR